MDDILAPTRSLIAEGKLKDAVHTVLALRKELSRSDFDHILLNDQEPEDSILSRVLICAGNEHAFSEENEGFDVYEYFTTWVHIDSNEADRIFWDRIVPRKRFSSAIVHLLSVYIEYLIKPYSEFEKNLVFERINKTWVALEKYGSFDLAMTGYRKGDLIITLIGVGQYDEAARRLLETREPMQQEWQPYFMLAGKVDDITFIRTAISKLSNMRSGLTDKNKHENYKASMVEFCNDETASLRDRISREPRYARFANELLERLLPILENPDAVALKEFIGAMKNIYDFEDRQNFMCDAKMCLKARDLFCEFSSLTNEFPISEIPVLDETLRELQQQEEFHFMREFEEKLHRSERATADLSLPSHYDIDIDVSLSRPVADELKKFPEALSTFVSAEGLWHLIEDKLDCFKELTFSVCNFLKTVELLIHGKISATCKGATISIPAPQGSDKKYIDAIIGEKGTMDATTLGNYDFFIRNKPELILKNPREQRLFLREFRNWVENFRNAHFHRDLITEPEAAILIREKTIQLIGEICRLFKEA